MLDRIRKFVSDEEGLTSVEYALLLALIVVVAIGVWSTLGSNVKDKVGNIDNAIGAGG
jgi:pilus assembly protein Flp/PilA